MWNGAFSPSMRKSIGSVRFLPLKDMSPDDWDFLDYDNLRETAVNRLARIIASGELVGFFDVRILEKAKAKNRYLWPARAKDVEDFDNGDHGFFRHEANEDVIAEEVDEVEEARSTLGLYPRAMVLLALRSLLGDEDNDDLETLERDYEVDYFWLYVAALSGRLARRRRITLPEAVTVILEWLDANTSIAAGRGLTHR